jgi:hypothetical protein
VRRERRAQNFAFHAKSPRMEPPPAPSSHTWARARGAGYRSGACSVGRAWSPLLPCMGADLPQRHRQDQRRPSRHGIIFLYVLGTVASGGASRGARLGRFPVLGGVRLVVPPSLGWPYIIIYMRQFHTPTLTPCFVLATQISLRSNQRASRPLR